MSALTPSSALSPTSRATAVLGGELSEVALRRYLAGLPAVDTVGATQRAAHFQSRSIKTESKIWGLDTAISMVDLTTLEGADTPGKVHTLAHKALFTDPQDSQSPRVAAVCVYGDRVGDVIEALGSAHVSKDPQGVAVAAVATAFPSGRASMRVKIADTEDAVAAGADEIDMVIDRGAFLSGRLGEVFDQIVRVKEATKKPDGTHAHLKVILETGELATLDNVRRASQLAILAGADFIKTSTGKVSPAATLPVSVVMLEAVRDWHAATGEYVGFKPAGGIRTAKDALRYLSAVAEIAGEAWLSPDLFRFGASSLLNDLVLQRQKMTTGHYSGPDYVSVD
ncbi:deoxyribose-phosphate aldolase [Pontimonas sp.]|uniref:deoxyribose-phosphate aldolase n=1 Tax=Pontimonas sp. TaxID=2304492 RepID=UPI0037CB6F33